MGMEEVKYFIIAVETEDTSEDRFEIRKSFRPVIKFFGSKKAAEEWVFKKWGNNLTPDEFKGRCLAAWKGKKGYYGWKEVKIGLFEISPDGVFVMPKVWAIYLE